jgi:hypothetical protein
VPKLILDKAIHDNGSGDAEEDPADSQTAVDDLCLFIHPLSLLAVRERSQARTDEGFKEYPRRDAERRNNELPKRDCVDRLRSSDQQTEVD